MPFDLEFVLPGIYSNKMFIQKVFVEGQISTLDVRDAKIYLQGFLSQAFLTMKNWK